MNYRTAIITLFASLALLPTLFPSTGVAENPDERIKTNKQVVIEAKKGITQISAEQLMDKMKHKKKFILLDIRTERERNAGYISGAIWMPRGVLDLKIQSICKNADTEIIVYCRKGGRTNLAVKTLKQLGYTHVVSLKGGVNAWGKRGYSLYNWHGEIKVINFDKPDPALPAYDIFKNVNRQPVSKI